MTADEKELLLKDLCARLPYGVKLEFYASATKQTYVCTLLGLEPEEEEPIIAKTENGCFYMLAGNVKPYLFPLSSMTEEQKNTFSGKVSILNAFIDGSICLSEDEELTPEDIIELFNFLNKNHFDYRGLIEKGLAEDATGSLVYSVY